MGRILSWERLSEAVLEDEERGWTRVLTVGCFDLLHLGHVRLLQESGSVESYHGIVYVGVNSDRSVRALKGEDRPILPQGERAELVAALWAVDYVVIFDEETPERLIRAVRPHLYMKGRPYRAEDLPERALVESLGGSVQIYDSGVERSASEIIHRIRSRRAG